MKKFLTIIVGVLIMTGCNPPGSDNQNKIGIGSIVQMDYTLKVEGEVVDSSNGKKPLEFTQGTGQLIPGVEKELAGLTIGDKKDFTVSPEDGYGNVNPEAFQVVPKSAFQDAENLKVGGIVSGQKGNQTFQAKIIEVQGDSIKLDFNHPLAGKSLNFDVAIVSVKPASTN